MRENRYFVILVNILTSVCMPPRFLGPHNTLLCVLTLIRCRLGWILPIHHCLYLINRCKSVAIYTMWFLTVTRQSLAYQSDTLATNPSSWLGSNTSELYNTAAPCTRATINWSPNKSRGTGFTCYSNSPPSWIVYRYIGIYALSSSRISAISFNCASFFNWIPSGTYITEQ